MRQASIPLLCSCIACVFLAGCRDENTAPAAVRTARVVVVTPHQLGVVAEGAGLIRSRYDSPVGFEVGGRLVSRYVDVGAVVTKGQKLAKLSDVDYQNRVTAAEGELATANAAVAQAARRSGATAHYSRKAGRPGHSMRTRLRPFRVPKLRCSRPTPISASRRTN